MVFVDVNMKGCQLLSTSVKRYIWIQPEHSDRKDLTCWNLGKSIISSDRLSKSNSTCIENTSKNGLLDDEKLQLLRCISLFRLTFIARSFMSILELTFFMSHFHISVFNFFSIWVDQSASKILEFINLKWIKS